MKIHSAAQLFHMDRQRRRRRKRTKRGKIESRCISATSNWKYTKNRAGHIKNYSRASTGHR
jgi:hypothetical protein